MVVRQIEIVDHSAVSTRQVNIIDVGEDWLDLVEPNPLRFPGSTIYTGDLLLNAEPLGDTSLVEPVVTEGSEFLPDIPPIQFIDAASFDPSGIIVEADSDLGGQYEALAYRAELVPGPQFTINEGIDPIGSPPAQTNSIILGGSFVTNNGVEIADDPVFESTNGVLSAEIWFRRDLTGQSTATIMGKGRNFAGEAGWNLGFDFAAGSFGALWVETEQSANSMGSTNYWRFVSAPENLQVNGWYHLILVIDPNEAVLADRVKVYRNSVAMTPTVTGSILAARNNNSQPLVLGKPAGFYVSAGAAGPYAYFRFYNEVALTQAQVDDLHNGCTPIDASTIPSVSGVLSCQYVLNDATGLVDTEGNGPAAVADPSAGFTSGGVTGCGP